MLILNFTHPLTEDQQVKIEQVTGYAIKRILNISSKMDDTQPFGQQVAIQADSVNLTPEQWQQEFILINPLVYVPAASVLIAELHGRMGYFPAIIRTRPIPNSTPLQFEVAEIINLQNVRDNARERRIRE